MPNGLAYPIGVAVFIVVLLTAVSVQIGWPVLVIFGVASVSAYVAWMLTTYRKPADPSKIVPLYLVALAAQMIHTVEEYIANFPGELAEMFGLAPVSLDFFVITIMGIFAAMWVMTAFGLFYRNPLANFLLWFFLLGPGIVNSFAHITFPFLGDEFYFPGLITVLLPTIMSIIVIRALIIGSRQPEPDA